MLGEDPSSRKARPVDRLVLAIIREERVMWWCVGVRLNGDVRHTHRQSCGCSRRVRPPPARHGLRSRASVQHGKEQTPWY